MWLEQHTNWTLAERQQVECFSTMDRDRERPHIHIQGFSGSFMVQYHGQNTLKQIAAQQANESVYCQDDTDLFIAMMLHFETAIKRIVCCVEPPVLLPARTETHNKPL